ncbi:MAG: lipocalin family protein [Bacteroidales bacterium]|nr:lipocalin family protein [Bacteroidales bacterium]
MVATMVCVALALLFAGCTDIDEGQIVGTWNVNSVDYIVADSPVAEDNHTVTETPEEGLSVTMTFNEDFTGTTCETYRGQSINHAFTYEVTDNVLNITENLEGDYPTTSTTSLTIEKLNKKKLVVSMDEVRHGHDSDGETYEYTETMRVNMTRA